MPFFVSNINYAFFGISIIVQNVGKLFIKESDIFQNNLFRVSAILWEENFEQAKFILSFRKNIHCFCVVFWNSNETNHLTNRSQLFCIRMLEFDIAIGSN